MIPMNLDLETRSTCNRTCPTCMRNSHPDKEAVSPWFAPNYLPEHIIYDAIEQMFGVPEFGKTVCLNYYNEPLMDERIPHICREIKLKFPQLNELYFHSNGDLLKEETAKELDGVPDRIVFTLYMDDPVKSKRAEWIKSLFNKTNIVLITNSVHVPTHYSPGYPVKEMAEKHRMNTCLEPSMRVVINHRRQYMLCCDDLIGNFDLGTFPETSIAEHMVRRREIQADLKVPGGRLKYKHCEACPRT